jgi:hypothetical protein
LSPNAEQVRRMQRRAEQAIKYDNATACSCFLNTWPFFGWIRSKWFRNSLGCKPRSFIRDFWAWFDYSKKSEEWRSNSTLLANQRPKTVLRRFLKLIWREMCKHRCSKLTDPTYNKDQDSRLRMPNKWHVYAKTAKQATKKRQFLVCSELPSLPSAGSRPGCFHTSLGCEPRSLILFFLWAGSIIKKKKLKKWRRTIQLRLIRQ